ncbi:peptidoglycan DD-metalloendopeptidase family protein [Roseibium sp.]|uniref:peptidoglycan DD-metalloendopeptidase family protein n=1 Tax=Roseibium sp. TaxID=1936156 RepID=UPI003A986EDE
MRTLRSTLVSRVALVSLTAGVLAGCSSAVERFGEAPIYTGGTANQRDILENGAKQPSYQDIMNGSGGTVAGLPPASNAPVSTGSISSPRAPSPVSSKPLPPVAGVSTAPVPVASAPRPVETAPAPETRTASAQSWRGWSAAGGTRIPVRSGDTVNSLSRRYGVPVEALVAVNGIEDPNQVRPGQMIVIPTYVYSDRNGVASQTASENKRTLPRAPKEQPIVTGSIRPAETVSGSAPLPDRKPFRQPSFAEVSRSQTRTDANPTRISATAPKAKPAARTVATTPRPAAPVASVSGTVPTPSAAPKRDTATPRVAVATPSQPVQREARPTEPIQRPQVVASADPQDTSGPNFRWPVRGRIISDFGTKPGGTRNDGVNLAVPEGTPVKAAGNGTVIYSGNELKGYGNLILVRHEDGWVSAYAHNSKLNVKRGDKVLRGDVIANAGATGSVSQPQVHFELRKGNKPVDPLRYLPKS